MQKRLTKINALCIIYIRQASCYTQEKYYETYKLLSNRTADRAIEQDRQVDRPQSC